MNGSLHALLAVSGSSWAKTVAVVVACGSSVAKAFAAHLRDHTPMTYARWMDTEAGETIAINNSDAARVLWQNPECIFSRDGEGDAWGQSGYKHADVVYCLGRSTPHSL